MPSYSSVIRTLRIIIPAIGALLLILFFMWPTISRIRMPHVDKAIIRGDRTELVNPHYEGKEKDGQRYVLTAERAIQVRADADHVTLIAPAAQLEKPDGTLGSKVQAKDGIYNSKDQFLVLAHDVMMITPNGDTFTTDAADVNLKTKEIAGKDAITGDGPKFSLTANGFTYNHITGLLTFTGPAKLILHGNDNETTDHSAAAPAGNTGAGPANLPGGAK